MAHWHDIRIHEVRDLRMPDVRRGTLSNGVPYYLLGGEAEPVLHLEVIFKAGRVQAARPAAARATATLIAEGTTARPGEAISESIEALGSTLRTSAGMDALSINLYCLSSHFEESLEILAEILIDPIFPEDELASYIAKRSQKLRISQKKNEYIAGTRFMHTLFPNHPYGYIPDPSSVAEITRGDLLEHHKLLGSKNMQIFLSGMVEERHIGLLEEFIGRVPPGLEPRLAAEPEYVEPETLAIDGPQHLQASIRIGRRIVHRNHNDYAGLFLMNVILGDYFGSRLMRNIREEKGLTYHIESSMETLVQGSCLVISTEAASENAGRVIDEIKRELATLREQPVPESELGMVRNYIMGNLMMQLDGPLKTMDVVKTLVLENAGENWFDRFVGQVIRTGPEDVLRLANKYLQFDDMHVVVVS